MAKWLTSFAFLTFAVNMIIVASDFTRCSLNSSMGITWNLKQCNELMPDPWLPISYISQYEDSRPSVNTQVVLNNLIHVNEIDGSVEVDLFFRNWWTDVRWNLTDLWDQMNPNTYYDGIDIFPLLQEEDGLKIWTPNMYFSDGLSTEVLTTTLKLRPEGALYRSQHMKISLAQPTFNLTRYPIDSQTVYIKYGIYGLTKSIMALAVKNPPIKYTKSSDTVMPAFASNPVWRHQPGDFSGAVYEADYSHSNIERIFPLVNLQVHIKREGSGVLSRFAFPVLVLLILAGFTFWDDFESRVQITLTILLSVSALYVVVIGSIPPIGYITLFDTWINAMYLLLAVCVGFHTMLNNLREKMDVSWRKELVVRAVQTAGRLLVIPFSLFYFAGTYYDDQDNTMLTGSAMLIITLTIGCLFFLIILIKESKGNRKFLLDASRLIEEHIEAHGGVENFDAHANWLQMLFLNYIKFGIVGDATLKPYIRYRHGLQEAQQESGLEKSPIHRSIKDDIPRTL